MTVPSFSYEFEGPFILLPNLLGLQPHFVLPYVIPSIYDRDDTEPEMLPYIAGIVRPFAYNFSSGVVEYLNLAKQGLGFSLKTGIFSLSNQFLRAKFVNLCRMAA